MKVGDLVLCPPTYDPNSTQDIWELAIVSTLYINEPKIGVVYLNEGYHDNEQVINVWFIDEIKLVSNG